MDEAYIKRMVAQRMKETGTLPPVQEVARPAAKTAPTLDPVLAARFARQKAKEDTPTPSNAPVTSIGSTADKTKNIDPKLAERWARDKAQKEVAGSSSSSSALKSAESSGPCAQFRVDMTATEFGTCKCGHKKTDHVTSPTQGGKVLKGAISPGEKKMDPVLAKRLAMQKEKVRTGESAVGEVGSNVDTATRLDPVLAKRLSRQEEKVHTGESAVKDVGSNVDNTMAITDPVLADRLSKQQEKVRTGVSAVEEVGSIAGDSVKLDSDLQARLDAQREKCATPKASYKAETVQAAWDNHFGAFGAQDVAKIMLDYTEASELRAFDHQTGKLDSCKGMAQIQKFFEGLFATLKDTSDLAAPTIDVTEDPKQVYLIWSCGASGIVSATDSFIFDAADNKISRQNIAFTSKAAGTAKVATEIVPATTSTVSAEQVAQKKAPSMLAKLCWCCA